MPFHYSSEERRQSEHVLPDIEVFYHEQEPDMVDDEGEMLPSGWYYWFCMPGYMPDSDMFGPYETEEEALEEAQGSVEE